MHSVVGVLAASADDAAHLDVSVDAADAAEARDQPAVAAVHRATAAAVEATADAVARSASDALLPFLRKVHEDHAAALASAEARADAQVAAAQAEVAELRARLRGLGASHARTNAFLERVVVLLGVRSRWMNAYFLNRRSVRHVFDGMRRVARAAREERERSIQAGRLRRRLLLRRCLSGWAMVTQRSARATLEIRADYRASETERETRESLAAELAALRAERDAAVAHSQALEEQVQRMRGSLESLLSTGIADLEKRAHTVLHEPLPQPPPPPASASPPEPLAAPPLPHSGPSVFPQRGDADLDQSLRGGFPADASGAEGSRGRLPVVKVRTTGHAHRPYELSSKPAAGPPAASARARTARSARAGAKRGGRTGRGGKATTMRPSRSAGARRSVTRSRREDVGKWAEPHDPGEVYADRVEAMLDALGEHVMGARRLDT